MIAYRIYARECTARRFHPVDVSEGRLVGNLIYATLFYSKDNADLARDEMARANPDYVFECRKVRGQS
jgi:hypothetical protein